MEKCFISYSHKDDKWVKEWLLPRLESTGVQVHIDSRDFQIGRPALINMETAVKECKWTILVFTPHWLESEWTRFEGIMLQHRDPVNIKEQMIPLMLEKCNLPERLSIFTYADFTKTENWETELGRMLGQKGIHYTPRSLPKTGEADSCLYKLPVTGDRLFGREKELKLLDDAWSDNQTSILTLVAWGGVGKTALVNQWLNHMKTSNYRGAQKVFGWSFFSQGAEEGKQSSADEFFQETLQWFGDGQPEAGSAVDKGRRLARLIRQQKTLLILDGLEPLQYPPGELKGLEGKLKDNGLAAFLKELAGSNAANKVLCIITTREPVTDLLNRKGYGVNEISLEHLSAEAGVELLKSLGVITGSKKDFQETVKEYGGHALALTLLGIILKAFMGAIFGAGMRYRY